MCMSVYGIDHIFHFLRLYCACRFISFFCYFFQDGNLDESSLLEPPPVNAVPGPAIAWGCSLVSGGTTKGKDLLVDTAG